MYKFLVLCFVCFGCAATNPALMSDTERSSAGIMSHRAEDRTNARCPTDGRKPSGWVECKGSK